MATILYLKHADGLQWQQVFFDGSQNFSLTHENPYFTQSEAYTLDVTLPMDIPQNGTFFKSIHRIDRTKSQQLLKCRLLVDNRMILDGTAKITQITQSAVKVQLLGGKSETNFLSTEENMYVDEMYLGSFIGFGMWLDYNAEISYLQDEGDIVFMPVYDETDGSFVNRHSYHSENGTWANILPEALQPRLLYIVKALVAVMGYTLIRCDFDCEPWNRLFIASAKDTTQIAHALPHWLAKDFFDELCNFFNCTLIIDQEKKTITFKSNKEFYGNAEMVYLNPVDEYTVDMNEDNSSAALATANIEYDLSSSDQHIYDKLTDERREGIPTKICESKSAALALYDSLAQDERAQYVYKCPEGRFVGWKKDGGSPIFMQIDHFAPLIRDRQSDNSKKLKICPVALMETTEALCYGYPNPGVPGMTCVAMSIENPTGSGDSITATAQELIEGDADINEDASKEDRMQLMFVDDCPQSTIVVEGDNKGVAATYPMPFTDCNYLQQAGTPHRSWSLSLNPTGASFYLGQLHQNPFTFNIKAKHSFKFISEQMPDPTRIYI